MTTFNNRVFGAAIIKAINSNYNADFSGQPRTLPDGRVYATDKAYKYTIKNYLKDNYPEEKMFYFKELNKSLNPISLDEKYVSFFGEFPKKDVKPIVATNLLSCLDIRFFGATFAGKTNVSIHGPLQVNHGVNIWAESNIFTEQITSPFSNKSNDPDAEKGMTTIGRQSKLEEGHYLHHFSINPKNLNDVASLAGADAKTLSTADIDKLKEGMTKGATYYDSASKAGTENEFLIWVKLKEASQLVLPSFLQLIKMNEEKKDGKVVIDLKQLSTILSRHKNEIDAIEIYRNGASILVENAPKSAKTIELL